MKITTGRINRLQRKLKPPGADREEFECFLQIRETMNKMFADPTTVDALGEDSVEKLRVWCERANKVMWPG